MKVPVIKTDRLILRGWKNSDHDSLYSLNSDPLFVKYIGEGKALTREESWRVLALFCGHWELKGFGLWAVELSEKNEFIGRVGLWEPEGWPGIELGWGISPDHWGRGYATEAARASLKWAFEEMRLSSLISIIHKDNSASKRVATRIGESYSHSLRIKDIDCDVYKITREDSAGIDV